MAMPSRIHVVWFKRDLRVDDHRPLATAAERGPVLPLYVAEPSIAAGDDYRPRHWTLIREALTELRARLAKRGQPLVVRCGEMPDVLATIRDRLGPIRLWAHEETGNQRTFARDRRVRAWAEEQGVPFTEVPHRGVIRGPHDRDHWAERWETYMNQPLVYPPDTLRSVEGVDPGPMPSHADLGLPPSTTAVQQLGEAEAHRTLDSFLYDRGQTYRRAMSRPAPAQTECSRMSVHLAFGTISLRRTVYELRQRQEELRGSSGEAAAARRKSLSSFDSRLHWHSHFTQKLEDAPRIENESYIPAFDDLRADDWDPALYDAWLYGRTGFPMVDACMRCLRTTGWLNFRMRAMLCSFAAYDCWLDWRRFAPTYGGLMADYVPGIHYPQVQMQSGTTGINRVRIYNPIKQGKEQDPDGTFIRRWVPELSSLETTAYVHEPWRMPPIEQQASGVVVGQDYPERIVDHNEAYHHAQDAIHELRERPDVQRQADAVLEQHGSRA
ncbi:MAG: deoxyribodipyrimidine photo-lyase/cryptochrome family protein [Bacteroidetes bacterium SW_11_64_17]|nr:MAG: deoxyribodipyrimidine photo-lyase/cryptochrome family protein [Bacteroidetes bacterium SW_11_64_17]